jgi:hypothetical protein
MYEKIAKLVGKHFSYLGCTWIMIEVLPEADSIVLRRLDPQKCVQANQYGTAQRLTQETLTIKISRPDNSAYTEELTAMLAGIIKPG